MAASVKGGLLAGAALALALACGGGSGATADTAATGTASILVTDAPCDTWSAVQVQVTGVTLVNKADQSRVPVFTGAAAVNLVDLDNVGELLANAQVPVGTYDKVIVTVNTDPAAMSLVPEGGTAVAQDQIHVVGGGAFTVPLSPELTVAATGSSAVQVDFDLAHPLFINQTARGTMVNFRLRHKPSPALDLIQLHRHLGAVTGTAGASFAMRALSGRDFTFATDVHTIFHDVDHRQAGSFSGLVPAEAVMVAARLQADGGLYAVRVWYCGAAGAADLPKWSPEGHVVSVDDGSGTMVVTNADGNRRTIFVDPATTFTFRNTVALGTG